MKIFPAIDLYEKKAVRLFKGDYNEMTVYSENPLSLAREFENLGAKYIHLVDLEGARDGTTPNIEIIKSIAENTSLFVEVGGGIRNMDVVDAYLSSGVGRVILGTAAVRDEDFLRTAVLKYGEKIAVGIDVRDGYVAIRGWVEKSEWEFEKFISHIEKIGVKTVILTDISRDGAMLGTNLALYRKVSEKYSINLIASGGVSNISDILALRNMDVYGAIIGKAYYTGKINLKEAIEISK
jgi:phosphoribosylformimino-5-aminoimidazole carboxamide ribotide isomerase